MEKLGSNLPAKYNSASDFGFIIEPFDAKRHIFDHFQCGADVLDKYLVQGRLRDDQGRRVTRGFVYVRESDSRVMGYYCLNAASVAKDDLPDDTKLPRYPVLPAVLLGKLAVHKEMQGKGIGTYLLLDSFFRTLECSRHLGIVAFTVEAFNKKANDFYTKYGCKEYELLEQPNRHSCLFVLIKNIEQMKRDAIS